MKKSDILDTAGRKEESDTKAWALHFKADRERRYEIFKEKFLPKLNKLSDEAICTEVSHGKFTAYTDLYGLVDLFPKSNKILIRKDNQWISNMIDFVTKKLLNNERNSD